MCVLVPFVGATPLLSEVSAGAMEIKVAATSASVLPNCATLLPTGTVCGCVNDGTGKQARD